MEILEHTISAVDGYSLAAKQYLPVSGPANKVILINSATAVPQRFYRHIARFFAEYGYTTITYDYRGIADSKPKSLRGFQATARDWALNDMQGIINWIQAELTPQRLFLIGHSYGGQTAGLLADTSMIDAMVTFSAQSGYWGLQGGNEKYPVAFHVHVTLPLLSYVIGYVPWSWFSSAEDLPKGVALEWSKWCRHPQYMLGDKGLPLRNFANFKAPVLAYSFTDDDWGTAKSVDAMMSAYPNMMREHIAPADFEIDKLGHFGSFLPKSKKLWEHTLNWLERE